MRTHNQLVQQLLRRKGVRADVQRIEDKEGALLDAMRESTAAKLSRKTRSSNPQKGRSLVADCVPAFPHFEVTTRARPFTVKLVNVILRDEEDEL